MGLAGVLSCCPLALAHVLRRLSCDGPQTEQPPLCRASSVIPTLPNIFSIKYKWMGTNKSATLGNTPKVFIMSYFSSPPQSSRWNLHLDVPCHFRYTMYKINIFFPPKVVHFPKLPFMSLYLPTSYARKLEVT